MTDHIKRSDNCYICSRPILAYGSIQTRKHLFNKDVCKRCYEMVERQFETLRKSRKLNPERDGNSA